ncbi:MAG: ADOP family duplicated permease [Terriglobia bacterium]
MSLWDWLFRRRQRDEELEEEVQSHLRMAAQDHSEQGETAEQARASAARKFGNVALVKDVTRDVWGFRWLETLIQDLRYGLRQLCRNPGFTAVAIITLALGIGANTAIFSVINAVLLRPLPYPDSDRLVMLWERNPARGVEQEKATGPDFIDWRRQNHVFESIAGWLGSEEFNLASPSGVEKVKGVYASSDLFSVLGVKPQLGRTFLPEEDQWQGNRVAVVSHELWQSRFGADPNVLGRILTVDTYGRRSYTIVGVMPPGFRFPGDCDLWLPAGWMGVRLEERRSAHWHSVIARLKPGVMLERARSEMNTIQARIAQEHPNDLIGSQVAVVPLLDQTVGRALHQGLVILWAAVACVLLVACTNLANLLLARRAGRQKEIAIRLAVGASRWRVIRQLLTESILLALTGGAIGVLWASWGLRLFVIIAASHIPRIQEVRMNSASLAFTLGISLMTGLLFGFAPAWQISKPDLNQTLKESSRSGSLHGSQLRFMLVVFEIALSLVLLIGAGLMTRSFVGLLRINRGFQTDHLLTAELDFSVSGFTTWIEPTPTRPQVTLQQIIGQVRNYPGITSVAAASRLPRDIGSALTQTIVIEGRPSMASGEFPTADFLGITPDYLRTLGIPLLEGRPFKERDSYDAPGVAIINETLARRYLPNENPIGKRLAMGGRKNPNQPEYSEPTGRPPWKEIVGVVADTKTLTLKAETVPEVYVPYWQWPMQSPALFVRTAANPAIAAAAIRNEMKAVNKNLPLPIIRTMDDILADSVAQPRYQTMLLSLFGVTALILAAVGIYGVTSYAVTQRTHEIGIRMALGAQRADVIRLVVGQGLKLTLVGVVIGIIGALALSRFLTSLLYGVKPTDSLTFIAVSLILLGVALLASYIPARSATKVDPMVALRYE